MGSRWTDSIWLGVGVCLLALLFAALANLLGCSCAPVEPMTEAETAAEAEAAEAEVVYRTAGLAVDVTDAHAMHDAGLPTRADVISWHMYGRWGFTLFRDGVREEHIWEELPGGPYVWDRLYGIEENRAYRFPQDGEEGL